MGRAEYRGEVLPGGEALRRAGIAPLVLGGKDGLALISANGESIARRRWSSPATISPTRPAVPRGNPPRPWRRREPRVPVALSDLHGPVEARGAQVADTRIHSVRLPSFVVTTEVVFGGPASG
jgi:Aromatic amino acid lyase